MGRAMKLGLAVLASLLTAGCVITVNGQLPHSDASSSNVMAVNPEPDYAEARAKLDAAKGELDSDPGAAERDFFAARVALFHAYADQQKQQRHDTALLQALGLGLDPVRHFGPAANEILWRSVIGRTAALKKLGREVEALTELPRWQVEAGFDTGEPHSGGFTALEWAKMHTKLLPATKLCPESLGSACADHMTWLQSRFSEVHVGNYGPYLEPELTIARNENQLRELPSIIKKLPDKDIVFALTLAGWKKEKDGTATLIRDGAEIGITSGTDTGKRRLAIEGEHVVVEKVMTNVQHEVVHSNSISIHLAPGQDFTRGDVTGGEVYVYGNLRKARTTREGPRIRYHLDKPLVISFEGLYQYGVDLRWAWAEEKR
jgi:hypothetical protein